MGEPTPVDCPSCGTALMLLPLGSYAGPGDVSPDDLPDVVAHTQAAFAIIDDEGRYVCPNAAAPIV
jgi:hypothetical protein